MAETPAPDHETRTDTAELLDGIDQERANLLVEAFDKAAARIKATNPEAMWAVALLQARVLSHAEIGREQIWVAQRFADLVTLALPATIMRREHALRAAAWQPPFDG
jgi:hypothetical protein